MYKLDCYERDNIREDIIYLFKNSNIVKEVYEETIHRTKFNNIIHHVKCKISFELLDIKVIIESEDMGNDINFLCDGFSIKINNINYEYSFIKNNNKEYSNVIENIKKLIIINLKTNKIDIKSNIFFYVLYNIIKHNYSNSLFRIKNLSSFLEKLKL